MVGRSNHAGIVAGADGAERGGAWGVLAGLGISADPPEPGGAGGQGLTEEQVAVYAQRIVAGETALTICRTEAGRAGRDAKLLKKHGAGAFFQRRLVSPRRIQN